LLRLKSPILSIRKFRVLSLVRAVVENTGPAASGVAVVNGARSGARKPLVVVVVVVVVVVAQDCHEPTPD